MEVFLTYQALPATGFVRLSSILAPTGRYPSPRARGGPASGPAASPSHQSLAGGSPSGASRTFARSLSGGWHGVPPRSRLPLSRRRQRGSVSRWDGRRLARSLSGCSYAKQTLAMRAEGKHVVCLLACGPRAAIAAAMGLPKNYRALQVQSFQRRARNRRLGQGRARSRDDGGSLPPHQGDRHANSRYLAFHGSQVELVRRKGVPGHDSPGCARARRGGRRSAGSRNRPDRVGSALTFLANRGSDGSVGKAETEACKLTLGRLGGGGVWLTPVDQINDQLAVAEGIETALSVLQITGLPTVAALSASGMRGFRWPAQVRRLWIAADNDRAGLEAALVLRGRALRASVRASIKSRPTEKMTSTTC